MTSGDSEGGASGPDDPKAWLAEHGDAMYAYAVARVRDPMTAEDIVQDALLAAMGATFDGRSTRRTWLIGIVRHRVLDHFRRRTRGGAADATRSAGGLDGLARIEAKAFDEKGKWASPPRRWPRSSESVDERLSGCLHELPPRTAEAFLLVARHGTPVTAVADLLATSQANIHQMMHRARLAMRRCLEAGEDV